MKIAILSIYNRFHSFDTTVACSWQDERKQVLTTKVFIRQVSLPWKIESSYQPRSATSDAGSFCIASSLI